MHFSTIILWLLVLIFGVPMGLAGISMFLTNTSRRDLDRFEQTDFIQLAFDQFPWYVRRLLSPLREEAAAGGFRELVVFTRPGFGSPNFCCVMISPDQSTYAEIEYVRLGVFTNILLMLFQPRYFFRHPLGIYGMVLTTAFANNHRLITTKLKFLSETKRSDKEFQFVSSEKSFRQMADLHSVEMRKIESDRGFVPRRFFTAEEYLEFEKLMIRRLVEEGRTDIERAAGDFQ